MTRKILALAAAVAMLAAPAVAGDAFLKSLFNGPGPSYSAPAPEARDEAAQRGFAHHGAIYSYYRHLPGGAVCHFYSQREPDGTISQHIACVAA